MKKMFALLPLFLCFAVSAYVLLAVYRGNIGQFEAWRLGASLLSTLFFGALLFFFSKKIWAGPPIK
jgi:hypothetical protein